MSQQPELTTPTISSPPQAGDAIPQAVVAAAVHPGPPALPQNDQRIPRWLERAELFLRVLLQMWFGLFAFGVPWVPFLWDQNPLFLRYPTVGQWAAHGAVRGVISGLGLLNLWIAFREAERHRDG